MAPLKVVSLISGGKDSFFSILHCLENGHEVVALANLYPSTDGDGNQVDDSDSYMYQTIGHTIIPMYEHALGLPLYRQEIYGTHVIQDKSYGPPSSAGEDETEALIPLLQKVKAAHPEVNAVNTGAILSDYQRTRVESVALRLGLTPLAYLWQWPNMQPHTQSSLLEDMAAVGQDSRIVKVASGDLDDSFLWKNVADRHTIRRLEKAASRFGTPGDGAVLGEGGEYETLAVSGPAPVWKGRIMVNGDGREVIPSGAGAAHLRLSNPVIKPMTTSNTNTPALQKPHLLEKTFQTFLGNVDTNLPIETSTALQDGHVQTKSSDGITFPSDRMLLSNLTGDGPTPAHETAVIMDKAVKLLQSCRHSVENIVYTSIILRDMADFASINTVYGSCFRKPNPPARATIACAEALPFGKAVMISLTSVRNQSSTDRQSLHVQSRSYWAPANIGPYSQAVSVALEPNVDLGNGSLVYIAGQIPLIPSTMELTTLQDSQGYDPFAFQTALALQHCVRIGRVMQVRQWAAAIVFITASSPEERRIRTGITRQAWEELHDLGALKVDQAASDSDSESFDVWDVKFGNAKGYERHLAMESLNIHDADTRGDVPPLWTIQVDTLPKGASVEWLTYGTTHDPDVGPKIGHLEHLLQVFKQQTINSSFRR